mmetsp:Transcript_115365/g.337303  ORF Transcript_115365/g.337303 Transcript_115365/m.337303 type:complete len:243 (-) Transcript_115365:24-752(-)
MSCSSAWNICSMASAWPRMSTDKYAGPVSTFCSFFEASSVLGGLLSAESSSRVFRMTWLLQQPGLRRTETTASQGTKVEDLWHQPALRASSRPVPNMSTFGRLPSNVVIFGSTLPCLPILMCLKMAVPTLRIFCSGTFNVMLSPSACDSFTAPEKHQVSTSQRRKSSHEVVFTFGELKQPVLVVTRRPSSRISKSLPPPPLMMPRGASSGAEVGVAPSSGAELGLAPWASMAAAQGSLAAGV